MWSMLELGVSNRMEWIADHSQSGFGRVRASGNWILRFFGLKIIGFRVFPQIQRKMYSTPLFLMYSYSVVQKINLFGLLEKRLPAK